MKLFNIETHFEGKAHKGVAFISFGRCVDSIRGKNGFYVKFRRRCKNVDSQRMIMVRRTNPANKYVFCNSSSDQII